MWGSLDNASIYISRFKLSFCDALIPQWVSRTNDYFAFSGRVYEFAQYLQIIDKINLVLI